MDQVLVPPSSLEAEKVVLGACLLHPTAAVPRVLPLLVAQDFYHAGHGAIFEAIASLDASQRPVDLLTVEASLRELGTLGQLNSAGGTAYLAQLQGEVVTVENVEYHALTVAKKADRRRWLAVAVEVRSKACSEDVNDDAFFEQAERALLALTEARRAAPKAEVLKKALRTWTRELEQRYERAKSGNSEIIGTPTGLEHLDQLTGGLRPGDLAILAARPAMGKTALALNVTQRAAQLGAAGLVFSLEMSTGSLVDRLVASEGRVSATALRNGRLAQADWIKITQSAIRMSDLPVWVTDTGGLTITEVRSRARRWRMVDAAKFDKAIVVVDYLQLLSSPQRGRNGNREQEVAEISRGLKALAKELGCPVLALAQLNRELERRGDKHPILSDLRESGSLEQDADIIAFLYRDEVYDDDEANPHKGTAELIVAKHRSGPTATLWLDFDAQHSTFKTRHQPPPTKSEGRSYA